MEGENGGNTVPEMEVASETQVLPVVSEAVEENPNYLGVDGGLGGLGVGIGGGEGELNCKRKRGRPRKQGIEVRQELMFIGESSASPQKRGRGRPRGSGKWQTLAASLGGIAGDSAASKFTAHTITIQTGENIAQRFCSLAQRASESVCILSASGTVSCAEFRKAGSGGGILRHEGHFEIISLSGSNLDNETGVPGKICVLSVQLANTDGTLLGGAVAGSLIAGGPTQLVVATFRQNISEQVIKPRQFMEPPKPDISVFAAAPLQQATNGEEQEAEVKCPASSVSPVSAPPPPPPPPPVEAVAVADSVLNGLNVNFASPHLQFNWNSALQPSAHVISDVNHRGVDDDQ